MPLSVRYVTIFCLTLCAPPLTTFSEVRINEIAWMGTTESHLCNWIELYNTGGQAVDLIDWSLQINDITRELADGEGSSSMIAADDYLLLKRQTATCPDPVPTVPGWKFTMGNLPNSGATLRLLRPDGAIADEVVGGTDWSSVGGNNETKDTAQLTDTGWITAEPTPGAPNANISGTTTTTSEQLSSTPTRIRSARAPRPQSLRVPDSELKVDIIGPDYGYVNQPLTLTASTSGVGDTIAASLQYAWNWGDFHNQGGGASVRHTYQFPGTYVITLFATYGRHEQVARHEVTILPTPLAIEVKNGLVHIHNTAPYEVDVSGVTISGASAQRFPPRSFIPAHGTITLTSVEVGAAPARPVLAHDRSGSVLASSHDQTPTVAGEATSTPDAPIPTTSADAVSPVTREPTVTQAVDEAFRFSVTEAAAPATSAPPESPSVSSRSTTTIPSRTVSADVGSNNTSDRPWWPPLALLILLVVAAAVLLTPYRRLEAD